MVSKTRMWLDIAVVVGLFIAIFYLMSSAGSTFYGPADFIQNAFHKNVDICSPELYNDECILNSNGKTLCNSIYTTATYGKCISTDECKLLTNTVPDKICFQGV